MKTQLFKHLTLLVTTIASLVPFSLKAEAFSLVTDPNNSNLVKEIKSLDIGGIFYDVFFKFGSFNYIFGNTGDLTMIEGKTPTFWNNQTEARSAAQSIIGALGQNYYTSSNGNDNFFVPYAKLGSFVISPCDADCQYWANLNAQVGVLSDWDGLSDDFPTYNAVERTDWYLGSPFALFEIAQQPPITETPTTETPTTETPTTETPTNGTPTNETPTNETPKSVPEPTSTLAILAAGSGFLAARKRKKLPKN